jgi:hypothetical protein
MANETDKLLDAEIERLQKRMQRSTGDEAKRQLGLTARAAGPAMTGAMIGGGLGAMAGGVGAIPGAMIGAGLSGIAMPLSDLAVTGYRAAKDRFFPPEKSLSDLVAPQPETEQMLPSQAFERLMTHIGLPEPQNATERVVQGASRGVLDGVTGAQAARGIYNALSGPAGGSQVGRGVADTLAQAPGLQATSGGMGAAVGGTAAELGAGPVTSMLAGTAAGFLPNLRPQNLIPSAASAERQRMNALLQAQGIPLSPGQQLASAPALTAESVMKYLPTSAPRVARMEDEQGRAYTRAINQRAGINADTARPEVLQQAQREFGNRYDALERATQLTPDPQFERDIQGLRQNYRQGLDETRFNQFSQTVDQLQQFVNARAQGAVMPGANFHQIDGELRTAASQFMRSDDPTIQQYGRAMSGLRDSLQDLMERSALRQQRVQVGNQMLSGQDLSDAWRETNRQYAVFSRIKDAMGNATGREKLNTGFIPPSALAAEQRANIGKDAYAMARDPFTELVRAGAGVLPDPVPNSGTAQRSFMQDLLTGGKRGAPLAGAGAALHGTGVAVIDPLTALSIPWAVANRWYAAPHSWGVMGLLGARAAQGAGNAERERPY